MIIICLMKGLSLIDIGVIWLLSLVCLLMRIMTRFLHYTGHLNFIKDHVLLMKVCVLLHIVLTSCLTIIKKIHVK